MGSCLSSSATGKLPEGKGGSEDYGVYNSGVEAAKGNTDHGSSKSSVGSRHQNLQKWKEELGQSGKLPKTVVNINTSRNKRVEDVYDGIHNGYILGTGAAGIVRKCTHRETGMHFAVKCLNVGYIERQEVIDSLREEVFVMCQADHPDIIRLEEVYESDSQIYLILDLLTGGDMFDRLEAQPDYHYSEIQCANIVKQMVSAVRYLHCNKVVHRDLKLENFLFENRDTDSIRLIDFGLSKHFEHEGIKHHDSVGTPYAIAPEIIKGEYDEKVDVWAIGIITYLLLCGESPFGGMDGESFVDVRQNILDGILVFEPCYIWDNVSDSAKNFVRRCLTVDPEKRPSAAEVQKDEWFTLSASKVPPCDKILDKKLVRNLLKFKDYSDLQHVLLEIVSFTLCPDQIIALKQEFGKIDTNGTGDITLEELKEVLLNQMTNDSSEISRMSQRTASSLTEDQVEGLFDSLRLNTSQTTIQYHKFVSAGLSRRDYDDRNLKLAFRRLDREDKGYITLTDLNALLSSSKGEMDEMIVVMWTDGLKDIKCKHKDKIDFEDFQHLFKGHRASVMSLPSSNARESRWKSMRMSRISILSALHMESPDDTDDESSGLFPTSSGRKSISGALFTKSRYDVHDPLPETELA